MFGETLKVQHTEHQNVKSKNALQPAWLGPFSIEFPRSSNLVWIIQLAFSFQAFAQGSTHLPVCQPCDELVICPACITSFSPSQLLQSKLQSSSESHHRVSFNQIQTWLITEGFKKLRQRQQNAQLKVLLTMIESKVAITILYLQSMIAIY